MHDTLLEPKHAELFSCSCSLRCEATMYIKYGYVRYYVHQISVTKDLSSLRKEEKKLVLHQQIGSFYTRKIIASTAVGLQIALDAGYLTPVVIGWRNVKVQNICVRSSLV